MPLRLVLLFLFFSLYIHYSSFLIITDTITPNQPLNDGQVLISRGSNSFALGFFSPGNTTGHRYIGVWYNKIPEQTVIWVANRDRPINGPDGILSITKSGDLVLSSGDSTVWSVQIPLYNSSTGGQFAPKAQLLDSGNLVLTLGGSSTQNAAWQSFDYPTHIFMPGMLVSLNRRTGFRRFLSSWKSNDDPGHGIYTFQVGPDSEFYVYRDGSNPVWRSGTWVGARWSGLPEMTQSFIFKDTYVDSPDEIYFTWTLRNASMASMFILNGETGNLERRTWHESSREWTTFWAVPVQLCDKYAFCGAFGLCNPATDHFGCSCFTGYEPKSPEDWYLNDGSEGCVRKGNISMCRNGEGFLKLVNVKLPETSRATTNMSMSLDECRQECLKNCTCSAFTSVTDAKSAGGSRGCRLFYGDLIDTREYAPGIGQDLFFRVDQVELGKPLNL